ncbi:LexA family transcriptional regulator [Paraflavitalea sp. CAU 1676]|uniref:S24 family peptidase n=1 Tax=Paraflavitalea sp. CAU 1676 TaxID=3032598 RepID=UPI0023DB3D32|nr:LexA family transcriptional regulator [Paraflavitalea sp. CAU 1676]MDF2189765.1 S24 family peptidase [Paraflavitalea sp. CAU 1676]
MAAQQINPLVVKLYEKLAKQNIKVPEFSRMTGIPKDRIYKWRQEGTSPKSEDEATIKAFLEEENGEINTPAIGTQQLEESTTPYLLTRRHKKTFPDPDSEGIVYVPIAALAGYSNRYHDPLYIHNLEKTSLPGFPYKGEQYRVFDVKGDSMEPTYKEGYHLVCERIEQDQWHQIANFYIYVIVLENDILVKRLFRKDAGSFVAISDNEEFYPQFLIPVNDIKELWLVKRKIDWEMAPPRKFEIKV